MPIHIPSHVIYSSNSTKEIDSFISYIIYYDIIQIQEDLLEEKYKSKDISIKALLQIIHFLHLYPPDTHVLQQQGE